MKGHFSDHTAELAEATQRVRDVRQWIGSSSKGAAAMRLSEPTPDAGAAAEPEVG